jgi:hypothetical protein
MAILAEFYLALAGELKAGQENGADCRAAQEIILKFGRQAFPEHIPAG